MPGIRIAPLEVETMNRWAAQKPAIQRLWVLGSESWSGQREDATVYVAALLAPTKAGASLPEGDTDEWQTELSGLIKPTVELTVIAPGTDPAGHVRGGVEIFRRKQG